MSKRAGTFAELREVIEAVGPDVARFFYLNRKAEAHLDFDMSIALKKTEENPVYYIQYAYVRTGSILRKAAEHETLAQAVSTLSLADDAAWHQLSEADVTLVKKIVLLGSILATIQRSYQTHLLSFYTLELSHAFHAYYTNNKVIDLEHLQRSHARLFMVRLVRTTLATCLDLLGVSKPKEM